MLEPQYLPAYSKLLNINNLLLQINSVVDSNLYDDVYFIIDKKVFEYHKEKIFFKLQKIEEKSILIEALESQKTGIQCQKIWNFFVRKNLSRRGLVLIIGGGITLDLGAFACSTWKRGVAFIFVPSTLLAMADASIGGKTGVNYKGIKNLIGTFAFPQEIWLAFELLETLPQREFRCGLSEIFKIALVADSNLWNKICSISKWDKSSLQEILHIAVLLKKNIVEQDPFERGLRKILNFGHTLAHALESVAAKSSFSLLHGEAVAIGMIIESLISLLLGKISRNDWEQICFQIKKHHLIEPLPLTFNWERLRPYLFHDKKNYRRSLRFSLLEGIGRGCYDVLVEWKTVKRAFENYTNA